MISCSSRLRAIFASSRAAAARCSAATPVRLDAIRERLRVFRLRLRREAFHLGVRQLFPRHGFRELPFGAPQLLLQLAKHVLGDGLVPIHQLALLGALPANLAHRLDASNERRVRVQNLFPRVAKRRSRTCLRLL